MPHLNWSERKLSIEKKDHPTLGTELVIQLPDPEARVELAQALADLGQSSRPGVQAELRLSLPSGWTVYWKERVGETRLLLAHPEKDEWVATVLMDPVRSALLIEALRSQGVAITLSRYEPLFKMSNVEITIHS